MTKKIAEFAFNGKGSVTLQVTTLVLLLTMSWKISAWKVEIEAKLDGATSSRWTSNDMSEYSNDLAMMNPDLEIPDVWELLDRAHHNH